MTKIFQSKIPTTAIKFPKIYYTTIMTTSGSHITLLRSVLVEGLDPVAMSFMEGYQT